MQTLHSRIARVRCPDIEREADLLRRGFGAVDDRAERGVLRTILAVPAEMLARDADALVLAVERVEVLKVRDEDRADFLDARRRGLDAGREELRDLAEDP